MWTIIAADAENNLVQQMHVDLDEAAAAADALLSEGYVELTILPAWRWLADHQSKRPMAVAGGLIPFFLPMGKAQAEQFLHLPCFGPPPPL